MRTLRHGLALAALLFLSGCGSLGYYGQALRGHLAMLGQARPVEDWLACGQPQAGPDCVAPDPVLRRQLALAQALRRYAVERLALPDNASYTRYADLGRDAAVWNVVAAPPLSLTLKTWCYPVLGCAGYRGFFRREAAQAFAAELAAQGLEVHVYGVPAYSSLGLSNWLGGDPLLNTFIRLPEGALARMIFHELAHQRVYADDDTAFNENYATAVETLGAAQWLADRPDAAAQDLALRRRHQEWLALTRRTRARLAEVYAGPDSDADKQAAKARALRALHEDYAALKARWGGDARYDAATAALNNASLAIQGSYLDLLPEFERLFDRCGRDWPRFHAEVRRLAALPAAARRVELRQGAASAAAAPAPSP